MIRDRLGESGRKLWAEAALNVVNEAFPPESDDVRAWKECDRLLPHAIVTADFGESLGVGLEATSPLINEMGIYARGRAEYANAKAAYKRALKIAEKVFGADHPNVGASVNNLGRVLWELGDSSGAKACFERALRISENAFGSNHPEVGDLR